MILVRAVLMWMSVRVGCVVRMKMKRLPAPYSLHQHPHPYAEDHETGNCP